MRLELSALRGELANLHALAMATSNTLARFVNRVDALEARVARLELAQPNRRP